MYAPALRREYMATVKIEKLSFEQGMEMLEEIVRQLESGEMSLEESFRAYEKGMAIQKRLKEILDDGDARIRILTETGIREAEA